MKKIVITLIILSALSFQAIFAFGTFLGQADTFLMQFASLYPDDRARLVKVDGQDLVNIEFLKFDYTSWSLEWKLEMENVSIAQIDNLIAAYNLRLTRANQFKTLAQATISGG